MAAAWFRFVQLEVPWPLGPADGRYVVRPHAGEAPEHVLVLTTLGAQRRGRVRGRREREAEPEPDPAAVPTGRATIIRAGPFPDDAAAEAWLRDADRDVEVDEALGVLARALHAHRVSTADDHVRPVRRAEALVLRLGYGEGEQVVDGRWTQAVELPTGPPRTSRRRGEAALRPQERLAALLGGRDAALACELLVLRARSDLDDGRQREAALQLRVALEAALTELSAWRGRGDMTSRLDELADHRHAVGAAANAALQGGLEPQQAADVAHVLTRLEAALRARTAGGFI